MRQACVRCSFRTALAGQLWWIPSVARNFQECELKTTHESIVLLVAGTASKQSKPLVRFNGVLDARVLSIAVANASRSTGKNISNSVERPPNHPLVPWTAFNTMNEKKDIWEVARPTCALILDQPTFSEQHHFARDTLSSCSRVCLSVGSRIVDGKCKEFQDGRVSLPNSRHAEIWDATCSSFCFFRRHSQEQFPPHTATRTTTTISRYPIFHCV